MFLPTDREVTELQNQTETLLRGISLKAIQTDTEYCLFDIQTGLRLGFAKLVYDSYYERWTLQLED